MVVDARSEEYDEIVSTVEQLDGAEMFRWLETEPVGDRYVVTDSPELISANVVVSSNVEDLMLWEQRGGSPSTLKRAVLFDARSPHPFVDDALIVVADSVELSRCLRGLVAIRRGF